MKKGSLPTVSPSCITSVNWPQSMSVLWKYLQMNGPFSKTASTCVLFGQHGILISHVCSWISCQHWKSGVFHIIFCIFTSLDKASDLITGLHPYGAKTVRSWVAVAFLILNLFFLASISTIPNGWRTAFLAFPVSLLGLCKNWHLREWPRAKTLNFLVSGLLYKSTEHQSFVFLDYVFW